LEGIGRERGRDSIGSKRKGERQREGWGRGERGREKEEA